MATPIDDLDYWSRNDVITADKMNRIADAIRYNAKHESIPYDGGMLSSGFDANDYKNTGFYGIATSQGHNMPEQMSHGLFEILAPQNSAPSFLQRVTNYDDQTTFQRTYVNGKWSSWYKLGGNQV